MAVDIRGEVRRFQKAAVGMFRHFRLTGLESLSISSAEDRYAELCRGARRFHGGLQNLSNGIAPTTLSSSSPPSTTPLVLYNGDPVKSYVLDWMNFYLASGTPAAGASLFVSIYPSMIGVTPPTANATGYASQSSCAANAETKALWTTNLGIPAYSAAALSLTAVQRTNTPAAANLGQGDTWVDLEGRFVIPPGLAMGFYVFSGSGTSPTFGIGCAWSELELDLE